MRENKTYYDNKVRNATLWFNNNYKLLKLLLDNASKKLK